MSKQHDPGWVLLVIGIVVAFVLYCVCTIGESISRRQKAEAEAATKLEEAKQAEARLAGITQQCIDEEQYLAYCIGCRDGLDAKQPVRTRSELKEAVSQAIEKEAK